MAAGPGRSPRGERVEPGEGQESAWDYPRPPIPDPSFDEVVVTFGGVEVARSRHAVRVLETSHPPGFYLPREDWAPGILRPARGQSLCEFKGVASYWDIVAGGRTAPSAAWSYEQPWAGWELLAGHVSVYPGRMDVVTVGGETVTPQEGDFYGGWITSAVVGPFKGGPGTRFW